MSVSLVNDQSYTIKRSSHLGLIIDIAFTPNLCHVTLTTGVSHFFARVFPL